MVVRNVTVVRLINDSRQKETTPRYRRSSHHRAPAGRNIVRRIAPTSLDDKAQALKMAPSKMRSYIGSIEPSCHHEYCRTPLTIQGYYGAHCTIAIIPSLFAERLCPPQYAPFSRICLFDMLACLWL